MAVLNVGESIPAHTSHVSHLVPSILLQIQMSHFTDVEKAVSVSLPTWKSNVGYEEGEDWVISKLTTGYPR
jgi:cystathionine gamma-synthase